MSMSMARNLSSIRGEAQCLRRCLRWGLVGVGDRSPREDGGGQRWLVGVKQGFAEQKPERGRAAEDGRGNRGPTTRAAGTGREQSHSGARGCRGSAGAVRDESECRRRVGWGMAT
jgi:hypothetical protein